MYRPTSFEEFQAIVNIGLDQPVTVLRYIGPYLKDNLEVGSFDPRFPEQAYPVKTLRDLRSILTSHSSRNVELAKKQLTIWLQEVLRNERALQCLELGTSPSNHIRLRNSTIRTYKISDSNFCAKKSIIQFWQFIANPIQRLKVPAVPRQRRIGTRYPADCSR